jgi:HEAT repeat protein
LTPTPIKLHYRSVDRFAKAYRQLKTGRLFLPGKRQLPVGSLVELRLQAPEIDALSPLQTVVRKHIGSGRAGALKVPVGMVLELTEKPETALADLDRCLAGSARYRGLPALNAPGGGIAAPDVDGAETAPRADAVLSMAWIRRAVAQAPSASDEAEEPEPVAPAISVKNELTPAERERVKPAGEFIMDLTKAMLRTGYYSPEHPGSREAKHGLYEAFLNCLGDSREMMITNQESREDTDIQITGLLDEPVSVKTLVGAGMAALFVPKLQEYFNRKSLISFAVKKAISREHFDRFVDIMSDPRVDRGENSRVGELLSQALVQSNITEISTVFMDDIIVLERNLPWRVEMAILRLAKDLKVLPMFEKASDESFRRMKLQIIQDIIRPLRHPEFLKDLIVNCYVIAQHVKDIAVEDIEKVIIEAFPMEALLPTSRFIFDELNHLRQISASEPENPSVKRRFAGVKRILKYVARRLVLADIRGANRFLEQLYVNRILKFEDLSPDVQYMVNTHRMACDLQRHANRYLKRLLQCTREEDALVLLNFFRRALPELIRLEDWRIVGLVARAVFKARGANRVFSSGTNLPAEPLHFVFRQREGEIIAAFEKASADRRRAIENTLSLLGNRGIELLCRILFESESREARKAAMAALIKRGEPARAWAVKILDDSNQKWFLKRNALMLIGQVSNREEDLLRARKHLNHPHARVRDEALSVVLRHRPANVERFIVDAIKDDDRKVRWRAINALTEIESLSEGTFNHLVGFVNAELSEDEKAAAEQCQFLTQVVGAFGAMQASARPERAEAAVLDLARRMANHGRGLFQRFKKNKNPAQSTLLAAAVHTLGQIGSPCSEHFLLKLAGSKSPVAPTASKAAETIRQRCQPG